MEDPKTKKLKVFLKIYGVISILLFSFLFIMTAIDSPLLLEGGALRSMRWEIAKHVDLMIEGIYIVWGIFMLLASRKPLAYLSFLSFTLWANLAHGLIMVPQALEMHYMSKFFTDIAYCIVLVVGLYLLTPKGDERPAAVSV